MASYREILLAQESPLDDHEIHDLERWLEALREDVETFGATPEDVARMAAIEDRIRRGRDPGPTP
jgi:ParB-like chromosome segregation protein Spo0J